MKYHQGFVKIYSCANGAFSKNISVDGNGRFMTKTIDRSQWLTSHPILNYQWEEADLFLSEAENYVAVVGIRHQLRQNGLWGLLRKWEGTLMITGPLVDHRLWRHFLLARLTGCYVDRHRNQT